MPHLNICNLTASVLRIVLVATKNTGLLSLSRMNLLHSLRSKTGKESFVTGVLASSALAQVLPDPTTKAVAVALSGPVSELAQAKKPHCNRKRKGPPLFSVTSGAGLWLELPSMVPGKAPQAVRVAPC